MNTPRYTTLKRTFAIDNKTDEGFDILEFNDLHRAIQKHIIQYAQLLDDYIYKNIPQTVYILLQKNKQIKSPSQMNARGC